MSNGRNKTSTPRAADDTTPILVPDGAGIWTFGDHLRHLAGHAGTIPLALDEYGRCLICLRPWLLYAERVVVSPPVSVRFRSGCC